MLLLFVRSLARGTLALFSRLFFFHVVLVWLNNECNVHFGVCEVPDEIPEEGRGTERERSGTEMTDAVLINRVNYLFAQHQRRKIFTLGSEEKEKEKEKKKRRKKRK